MRALLPVLIVLLSPSSHALSLGAGSSELLDVRTSAAELANEGVAPTPEYLKANGIDIIEGFDSPQNPLIQNASDGSPEVVINVYLGSQTMSVQSAEMSQDHIPIAAGRFSHPTAPGHFPHVFLSRRTWSKPYKVWMEWCVFFNGNDALHYDPTCTPSHGCVHQELEMAKTIYTLVGRHSKSTVVNVLREVEPDQQPALLIHFIGDGIETEALINASCPAKKSKVKKVPAKPATTNALAPSTEVISDLY
jgi:hypothetical protein